MSLMARDRSKLPPVVCFGMAGCLVGVFQARETLGLLHSVSLRIGRWSAWVLVPLMMLASTPPVFWDADDLAQEIEDRPSVWTDGSREDDPVGGFEVAGAGVYLPAPEEAMRGDIWELRKNVAILSWSAVVLYLCQFLVHFRLFSALSSGVRFWRYRPYGLVILVLIISMWSGPLVGC